MAPLLLLTACATTSGGGNKPVLPVKVAGTNDAINITAGTPAVARLADGATNVLANDTVTNGTVALAVSAVTTGQGTSAVAGAVGQPLTGTLGALTINANGTLAVRGASIAGAHGSVTIAADGSYTYTLNNSDPAVQALGNAQTLTDSFDYRVTDGLGGRDTATLVISIGGTDEPGISLAFAKPISGDVLLGAGNDRLDLASGATVSGKVDGLAGNDTLVLTDWNGTITLAQVAAQIDHVETIQLGGLATQTQLNISAADFVALLPVDDIIRFTGGGEDRIHFDSRFVQGADVTVGVTIYHTFISGGVTAYVDGALPVI